MSETAAELSAIDYVHTGPGTLAGRFLRLYWQPVFIAADLPTGRAMPVRILNEEFTLFRGESGRAQLLAPRCAHRGTLLSTGRVLGDRLQCFYHGWTYDSSGQCVDQPAEQRGFADKVCIRSYPTREYLGLIFGYFGEGEPPPLPHFSAFDQEGYILAAVSKRPWNFFSQLENSVDEVHINFVHRASGFTSAGLNAAIPVITGEETDYGIARFGTRGNEVRRSHILMPNCMFSMVYEDHTGWTEHLAWRVPIDDVTHASFMVDLVHKTGAAREEFLARHRQAQEDLAKLPSYESVLTEILAGRMTLADVADRPDIVTLQDGVALRAQGAIPDRKNDRLAASDRQVALLRRIWTRELHALSEGRPLKTWRWPADVAVTTGVST